MSSATILILLISNVIYYTTADCPYGIIDKGINESEKEIILKKHNYLRTLLAEGKVPEQPKGTNFKTMAYCKILAGKAQEIAESCEFAHKEVTGTGWGKVGQNVYMSVSSKGKSGSHWNSAIQKWFDEHKNYTYGSEFSSEKGHYTQVVWADTDYVGCGYAFFKKKKGWFSKLYVCNYGSAGNIVGQTPYKTEE